MDFASHLVDRLAKEKCEGHKSEVIQNWQISDIV